MVVVEVASPNLPIGKSGAEESSRHLTTLDKCAHAERDGEPVQKKVTSGRVR